MSKKANSKKAVQLLNITKKICLRTKALRNKIRGKLSQGVTIRNH